MLVDQKNNHIIENTAPRHPEETWMSSFLQRGLVAHKEAEGISEITLDSILNHFLQTYVLSGPIL